MPALTDADPVPTFEALADEFEVDPDPIGFGGFGTVHFALQHNSNKTVAVKAISKERTAELSEKAGQRCDIETEVELARDLGLKRHRNILKFYGTWQDEQFTYVVLQLCAGGEMPEWLLKQPVYTERQAARITYDILQALAFLADNRVVHRDVKPQNLLFTDATDAGLLKLVDFGMAACWEPTDPPLSDVCGTTDYMSPEMLARAYSDKVDLWAVGVVLHTLLSGRHPFRGPSQAATEERIKSRDPTFEAPHWQAVSDSGKDLLAKLLCKSPADRPSARQALRHAWLKERSNTERPNPLDPEIPAMVDRLCTEAFHQLSNASVVRGGPSPPLQLHQQAARRRPPRPSPRTPLPPPPPALPSPLAPSPLALSARLQLAAAPIRPSSAGVRRLLRRRPRRQRHPRESFERRQQGPRRTARPRSKLQQRCGPNARPPPPREQRGTFSGAFEHSARHAARQPARRCRHGRRPCRPRRARVRRC